MARLTVWTIPMKRSVHVNHFRWPVLMECALISFGFAMGQTIVGITQTNRTATHQQLHQVKYRVVYIVIFFSIFCCCLYCLFSDFHVWCVDTSCDGWFIIAITKQTPAQAKETNKQNFQFFSGSPQVTWNVFFYNYARERPEICNVGLLDNYTQKSHQQTI